MVKSYKPRVKRERPEPTTSPVPVLARVGDPFLAPDGSLIAPSYPEDYFPRIREETKIDPVKYRAKRRRNMNELPGQTNIMNAVGAVMMYTFFGVGDREIANALKCSVPDIEEIRAHTAYAEYLDLIGTEIINAESENVTHRIAAYAHGALDTIAHVSRNGKVESNRLRASIDIMDRGGFNPKMVAEKQISLKNVLRIQVLDEYGTGKQMNIEINSEVGGDDGDSAELRQSSDTDRPSVSHTEQGG
jgi:hypothetical protein